MGFYTNELYKDRDLLKKMIINIITKKNSKNTKDLLNLFDKILK